MKRWSAFLMLLVLSGGLLALLACAAQEKALPGEGPAPAAPGPPAQAILPRKDAWQEEWDKLVAAAKQEGKVALVGPPGSDVRRALTDTFKRKYGIDVEILGGSGSELVPRIRAEREAGQHLWDIFFGGASISLLQFRPMGALDPLEPALILPEVKDAKSWTGGGPSFADKERQVLVMTLYGRSDIWVNTNLVKAEEIKSYRDLLDPKWSGKIILHDPRIGGPGQAMFTFFYLHKDLGPTFIRQWSKQKVTISRDTRQQMEWVAQGRYPLLVGGSPATAQRIVAAGAPIRYLDPRQLKEGGYASPGWGTLALMNRAPHPNAAKVYINWLLTREGQTELSRAAQHVSLRLDVPREHVPPYLIPDERYIPTHTEEAMAVKEPLVRLLRELFGD